MNGNSYILRWKGGSMQKDEMLSASGNPVRIGQKDGCDVMLPNEGPFADEVFAVIVPNRSVPGWHLIPVSAHVRTLVNGVEAGLVHYLDNGDCISFSEGQSELTFELREGRDSGPETRRYSVISRRMVCMLACAAVLVFAALVLGILWPGIENSRNLAALRSADASVLILEVDSVYFVRNSSSGSRILRRGSPAGRNGLFIRGTAFLSEDGELVTARHCIEPWLNFKRLYDEGAQLPKTVGWAMEAETFNQTHKGGTTYRVVSHCRLFTADGEPCGEFLSSDFLYDDSRDEIVELGDYSDVRYWRSVSGRFNRSDMMLGDIAVLRNSGLRGTIRLAPAARIPSWLKTSATLHFKGYPNRVETGMENREGKVLRDFIPGHLISHNGGLEPGFSGGPVLIARRGRVYAVGVVSTFDRDSDKCIYSVPVTEIPAEK